MYDVIKDGAETSQVIVMVVFKVAIFLRLHEERLVIKENEECVI